MRVHSISVDSLILFGSTKIIKPYLLIFFSSTLFPNFNNTNPKFGSTKAELAGSPG